jgi:hypothetical protein
MSGERKYDQLDFAHVTSFEERSLVERFARAAAAHLAERPDHWTYTDAEINGGLLAIRWGTAGQAVLVCRLDEGFRAQIFGDCLPSLEKARGGDGGGWVFYAHRPRHWLEGIEGPVDILGQRLADVLAEVTRNYLRAHGAPDGPVRSLARRLSEESVPAAFRRVFGQPEEQEEDLATLQQPQVFRAWDHAAASSGQAPGSSPEVPPVFQEEGKEVAGLGTPTDESAINLHATTDAMVWAREYVRMHGGDEGLMLSWFANAIETGRDFGSKLAREATIDARRFADSPPPLKSAGFAREATVCSGWFVTIGLDRFWFDLDLWARIPEGQTLEFLTELLRSRTRDGLQPAVTGYNASSGFRVSWQDQKTGG